jgi:NodT family efflux transporter outer membrane factor (OMF) lipoprotein
MLRQAGARIAEARALRLITVGALFPQQQYFSAQYSHNLRTGFGNRHFSVWSGQFGLAWELDLWGRYRRAIETADADLDASVFDYGDVVVTLVADVAATYIDIRTLQAQLKRVRSNVENQRRTYQLAETRFRLEHISEVDVLQAESNLAQTEAFVPQLELALRQSQNQLCVLLGIPPEDLTSRLGDGEIPDVQDEIAVGLPAELLFRRPDVRRAERQLAAQSALIGVAESDFYPQISVSGNVGRIANHFKRVFQLGAGLGSVGPSLRWDILHYGRIFGNVQVQDARFQQLLAAYRQSVLVANQEAENAIVQFLKTQETFEKQLVAARAADETNQRIILQLEEGLVDYNRVINVQSFKTQQETSAALAKGDVAQGLIAIYRALGGGWPSPFLGDPNIAAVSGGDIVESEEIPAPSAEGVEQPDQLQPSDAAPAVEPVPTAESGDGLDRAELVLCQL